MILWLGTAFAASLSGTVTDVRGDAAAGVYVAVYDEAIDQVAVDGPTGVDGRWRVEVPEGRYRVRVVPGMAVNLVESWEPQGVLDVCQARVHQLDETSVQEGADITLADGLMIGGTLVTEGGEAVAGAGVAAVSLGGEPIQTRQAVTDSAGRFELRGMSTDRAWFVDVQSDEQPRQYLPGTYSRLGADPFDGEPGERVQAGQVALLPGITVGGVLSGPDGPVPDTRVSAFSPNQIRSATTDGDGRYEIVGLPPGDVTAWSTPDGHAKTYYPDSDRPGPRVSVPDEGGAVFDLHIDAPYESVFDGRLLGDGDLSTASVLLSNDTNTVGFGARVEADGRFQLGALHGGDWALQVQPSEAGYLPGLVGGDGSPTLFAVPDEGVLDVEIDLIPAVSIEGVVRRADGEPAYDALVTVTSRDTGDATLTWTGPDGRFAIRGLRGSDTYDLSAEGDPPCANDPSRVRMYHPATPDPQAKVGLALRGGDVFTWEVTLPDDGDRDGMDDEWERRWGLDPERADALEDPDGDGNVNLVEYWVDDDPFKGRGGCGGGGSAFVFLLPLVLVRPRRWS